MNRATDRARARLFCTGAQPPRQGARWADVGRVAMRFALPALLLAGCSAAPVPPTVWLRLTAEGPPAASAATAAAAAAATDLKREPWQLMLPVSLPVSLDRDTLFVPAGAEGALVRPLAGARWVEPLRDAVPRLLRQDLVSAMGTAGLGALWTAPLPVGFAPPRQLRVEITTLEISADGRALDTRARWSIADAQGGGSPVLHEAAFRTPVPEAADPGAWALAHRQAVAVLATRIAATLAAR